MKRILLFFLLCLAPLAGAEYTSGSDPAQLSRLSQLYREAALARDGGQHQETIAKLQQALELAPFTGALVSIPAELHVEIGHSYLLLGDSAKAREELRRGLDLGYAESDELTRAPWNKLPDPEPLLAAARANAAKLAIVSLVRWDNPDLDPTPEGQRPQSQLQELRSRYDLDAVAAPGRTELERQLRLLDWVHHRWRHDGLDEPTQRDALSILREVEQGKRFRCVEYSRVLEEVLQAMGYPARSVGLRRQNCSFGTGKGHVVSEAWNNELGQWVLLDGQNNSYWEAHGKPLSAAGVRAAQAAGTPLKMVCQPSRWAKVSQSDWDVYFSHLTYAGVTFVAPTEKLELLFQGSPDRRRQTSDARTVYPSLGRVHADVELTADKRSLQVVLRHNAPWFSHYELTVDGQPPQRLDQASWLWPLQSGRNRLQVQAVNERGVPGPATVIELDYARDPAVTGPG